eukprot:scaffold9243_cov162-Amphora_coffeaeformis.AAC.1
MAQSKAKLTRVTQEKLKLEREQRAAQQVARNVDQQSATDVEFYKRKVTELTGQVQSLNVIVTEKNRLIEDMQRQIERSLSRQATLKIRLVENIGSAIHRLLWHVNNGTAKIFLECDNFSNVDSAGPTLARIEPSSKDCCTSDAIVLVLTRSSIFWLSHLVLGSNTVGRKVEDGSRHESGKIYPRGRSKTGPVVVFVVISDPSFCCCNKKRNVMFRKDRGTAESIGCSRRSRGSLGSSSRTLVWPANA